MSDSDPITRLNAALEGRYQIERMLGEGGMATVYLADDIKHERKVALKVLKPELAAVVGAERFLAEIKTTANLTHPHILPLHDSGEAGGFLFYVMPYVEGESLRNKLDREHQLPVDDAVRIASDVAEALDYAHSHGVIHRDIKPANILIQAGRPVIADFGIALAVSASGADRLTETGLSVGTPHYMSPEQATGDQTTGPATDTYALGCVLYEMLVGEPPYTGSTAQAILGKIIAGQLASAAEQRASVPANVDAAIRKALEKLPADRFTGSQDFASALKDAAFRHPADRAGRVATGVSSAGGGWRTLAVTAGLVATVSGALAWLAGRGGSEPAPVERQRILLGSGPERIPEMVAFRAALHPDGRGIVFADTTTVDGQTTITAWWKGRDQIEATRLPTMDGAVTPTFSPDGEWVVFVRNGELRREPLTGGNSIVLASGVMGGTAHALAWLDDETIVFENAAFILQRIPDSGQGEAVTVSTEEQTGQPIHAVGLPGAWGVLVSACVNSCPAGSRLSLLDLEADTVVTLADDVVRAWPAPDSHVVYLTRSGDVFSARLDRESRSLGSPTPLFGGVRVSPDSNGEMHVAPDGTALFIRGTATMGSYRVVQVDRSGRGTRLGTGLGGDAPENFTSLALSPDGGRLAATIGRPGERQLWVKELRNGPFLPVTPNETFAARPFWYRDGSRIAYVSNSGEGHVLSVRADGTSLAPDTLFSGVLPESVEMTGGGDTLLLGIITGGGGFTGGGGARDVVLVATNSENDPVGLLESSFSERAISLSPDGRWLVYVSDLSGSDEVYVQPFPELSRRRNTISLNGGTEPVWGRSGNELFYRSSDGWMVAAQVTTDSVFRVEGRERLFDASGYATDVFWRAYDVLPGDQRFVMLQPGPGGVAAVDDLVLVENLFELLGGRVPNCPGRSPGFAFSWKAW